MKKNIRFIWNASYMCHLPESYLRQTRLEFLTQGTESWMCLSLITKMILLYTQCDLHLIRALPQENHSPVPCRTEVNCYGLSASHQGWPQRIWRTRVKENRVWKANSAFLTGFSLLGLNGKWGTVGENEGTLGTELITRESGHHVLLNILLWITSIPHYSIRSGVPKYPWAPTLTPYQAPESGWLTS